MIVTMPDSRSCSISNREKVPGTFSGTSTLKSRSTPRAPLLFDDQPGGIKPSRWPERIWSTCRSRAGITASLAAFGALSCSAKSRIIARIGSKNGCRSLRKSLRSLSAGSRSRSIGTTCRSSHASLDQFGAAASSPDANPFDLLRHLADQIRSRDDVAQENCPPSTARRAILSRK